MTFAVTQHNDTSSHPRLGIDSIEASYIPNQRLTIERTDNATGNAHRLLRIPLTRITRLIRHRLQQGYSPLNRFTLNGFIFDRAQRNCGVEGERGGRFSRYRGILDP